MEWTGAEYTLAENNIVKGLIGSVFLETLLFETNCITSIFQFVQIPVPQPREPFIV